MNPTATGSKVIMWSPGINGGQPVRIADWSNIPNSFISDTTGFNNNLRRIQVGMTPVSHPSIAFSNDGSYLSCLFSTVRRDTSVYGYHFNSIYGSYSTNNGGSWVNPATFGCVIPESETACPWCDQIYPSLSKTGNSRYGFHFTYSLSTCPGSASFTDVGSPVCKVYQMYDKFCPEPMPGVVINTGGEIPKSYSLSQNFPNPFNPSTVIRFDIIKATEVKISVYDITGKEIARLVQQKLNAGKYSVDFDAAGLATGVYFYSIIAGEYVQTKKMMLVK
ncbi:MAG: T9SS type A sorting domain-containing protein [Ignavibacteria bacterium]|nr:T9SS type A sorting domain-containing protein [Ignavibacteria bacterium]MCC7158426.1 T9SS type A sorting domain-containing protein [Ignavibacteria bacterium]